MVPSVQFKKPPSMNDTFSKSITPPWLFLRFLKMYRWYQIEQSITYVMSSNIRHASSYKK